MAQKIQDIYNQQSQLYKSQTQDFVFPGGMFEFFISELTGKEVLDIGCGYGREVRRLRNLGFNAYGVDISKGLLDIADSAIKDYLSLGDMKELKNMYSGNEFDGIISSASLVHMSHDEGIQVMQNIFDILSVNGVFFLSLKVDVRRKIVEKESISTPGSIKKYVYYGGQEIEDILTNIGFSILKTHTWKPGSDMWKILVVKK